MDETKPDRVGVIAERGCRSGRVVAWPDRGQGRGGLVIGDQIGECLRDVASGFRSWLQTGEGGVGFRITGVTAEVKRPEAPGLESAAERLGEAG